MPPQREHRGHHDHRCSRGDQQPACPARPAAAPPAVRTEADLIGGAQRLRVRPAHNGVRSAAGGKRAVRRRRGPRRAADRSSRAVPPQGGGRSPPRTRPPRRTAPLRHQALVDRSGHEPSISQPDGWRKHPSVMTGGVASGSQRRSPPACLANRPSARPPPRTRPAPRGPWPQRPAFYPVSPAVSACTPVSCRRSREHARSGTLGWLARIERGCCPGFSGNPRVSSRQ